MSKEYRFIEHVDPVDFNKLAFKDGVKSHFLGSAQYGKVAERRGRIVHYVGMEKDGNLVATALLLQKTLFLGYSYFYVPRGFTMDYSDRELLKEFTKAIDDYCRKHKSIYFKIDPDIKLHAIDIDGNVVPGGDNNYELVEYLKSIGYTHLPLYYYFEGEQPRFTFRTSLEDDITEIEKRYGRTTKNCLRYAEKYGVEVVKGTRDDIDEFCRLMTMTEKRKDFFSHEESFYHFFYDLMAADDMASLYLGYVDIARIANQIEEKLSKVKEELVRLGDNNSKKASGKRKELNNQLAALEKQQSEIADKPRRKVVASAYLMTHYDDKAWTLYAGNDMDYGKFYANYAVYQRQIEDAKARGIRIFDGFGTVGRQDADSTQIGLYEFKKKWGGEFCEFIGEFDYVENPLMYFAYKKLIPYYHKMVNKRMRNRVKKR